MDLDEESKTKHGRTETNVDNPALGTELESDVVNNYWLNEIKSQEDTARQLIAICTLLLGASITIITQNISNIVDMINIDINSSISQYSASMPIYQIDLIVIITWAFLIIALLSIWIHALNIARKALIFDSMVNNEPLTLNSLIDLAKIKHEHCMHAIYIIIISSILVAFFIVGLVISTSEYAKIGVSIACISGSLLFMYVLNDKQIENIMRVVLKR